MPYLFIESFSNGVDTRRSRFTLPAGALVRGRNVHLTRGGELEVRKAFVEILDLAGLGTVGLFADRNGLLTFGSDVTPPGLPAGIQYQRLEDPDGGTLTEIVDATLFNGLAYVIGEFSNGNVNVYYNGQILSAFRDGIVRMRANTVIADDFAAAINAHPIATTGDFAAAPDAGSFTISSANDTAFQVTGRSVDTQTGATTTFNINSPLGGDLEITREQQGAPPTTAVPAIARVQITGGTTLGGPSGLTVVDVLGVNLLNVAVTWAGSNTATAAAVVASINAKTSITGYTAMNTENVVSIIAPDADGAAANGRVITYTTDAGVTLNKLGDFQGGVTGSTGTPTIYRVAVRAGVESYKALSVFVVSQGNTYLFGAQQVAGVRPNSCTTLKGKVYLTAGTIKYFSALNDPTNYEDQLATAGFINMANEFYGADELVGLGVYQGNLATFARRQAFVYFVDGDPGLNRLLQALNNTGAVAEGSIVGVGDVDLFYLSDTGVRSLRARDSSNYAAVNDIGTPIDTTIVEALRTMAEDVAARGTALIEPVDGRYWLLVDGIIYVFTSFQTSKIAAWTTYETSGFDIIDMASLRNRVYARGDNDKVYLYGGELNNSYETMDCEVVLPFLDAKTPAAEKTFTGIDASIEGQWEIYMACNMQRPDSYEKIAEWASPTYDLGRIPAAGRGTHVSIKLKHQAAAYARIGNLSIHYTGDETG